MQRTHPRVLPAVALALVLGLGHAAAQSVVIPAGYANAVEDQENFFPFGTTTTNFAGLRVQLVYDSTDFTTQSINYPVLISGVRFRAADTAASWTGGTFSAVAVRISTAAVDHLATSLNFAANHGPDLTIVQTGAVTVSPGTGNGVGVPGPYYVDIPFTGAPFLYDPSTGNDLCIEFNNIGVGANWSGGTTTAMAIVSAAGNPPPNARRVFSSTAYPNPNGVDQNINVLELTYTPASGIVADFTADVTAGASPLLVNFTDTSSTSAPAGIQSWAWDFENDGTIDSTLQHPTHTFATCGDFDVALTVGDGQSTPRTIVKTGYIRTDELSPAFTVASTAPFTWLFTDTTTPTPGSWAWDFEDDGTVDATTQTATYVSSGPCLSTTCRLDVALNCRNATLTEAVLDPGTALVFDGELSGGNGATSGSAVGNYFDMTVTAPEGIEVCGLRLAPYSHAGPTDVDVWLTGETHAGKEGMPALWRHVGHGTCISSGGGINPPTIVMCCLDAPVYMPRGDYGVAIYLRRVGGGTVGVAFSNGPAGAPYVGTDITIHPAGAGCSSVNLLGNCLFAPRLWNGGFLYTKCTATNMPGYGFFGEGCAGSAGVPELRASGGTAPALGTTFLVEVDNVPPAGIAIMITGLDNALSPNFGALPFDGTASGAPGCLLRASDETSRLLPTGSPTTTWDLPIPNDPGLLCVTFFNQALVFSPGTNAANWVISDAYGLVVGH